MSNEVEAHQDGQPRSTFVTKLARIFIILSAFSTLISAFQYIMFFLISPKFRMDKILQSPELASKIPPFHRFMLSHVQLLMLAMLVIFGVTLVSAIALLRRKNWARIVFITLMSLGIAYSLGMFFLLPWLSDEMKGGPGGREFEAALPVIRVFTTGFSLGLAAVFAWIIGKLLSRPIRGEFIRR